MSGENSRASVTAGNLLGFRLCTGQCLLGLEEQCVCRCRGRWHAVLVGAEIPIPQGLTLAAALSGGPAGAPARRRMWAEPGPGRGPVSTAVAELHFRSELAAGHVPSVRRIQRELRVGAPRARVIRQHLARQAFTT